MKELKYLLLATLLLTIPQSAHAERYAFDAKKSTVEFTLKHLGMTTVTGDFKAFQGHFRFDPEAIGNSWVTLEIARNGGLPHRRRLLDKGGPVKRSFP